MGSAYSSYLDRSQCAKRSVFEPWPITAVAAACARAAQLAQAEPLLPPGALLVNTQSATTCAPGPMCIPAQSLRGLELSRIQFHDIFVDYSYILPALAEGVNAAAEIVAEERALDKAEKDALVAAATGNAQAPQGGDAVAAPAPDTTAAREMSEEMTALTATFKGLRDDVFDYFIPTSIVGKQQPLTLRGVGSAPPITQRIRAMDVLVVLTLMCKSTVCQKVALLYHMFSDQYVWSPASVRERWLHTKDVYDCLNSVEQDIRVFELQDMIDTIGTAMRRVGIGVADIPFSLQDVDAAAVTLPRIPTVSLPPTRGAKRLRAAMAVVRQSLRTTTHSLSARDVRKAGGSTLRRLPSFTATVASAQLHAAREQLNAVATTDGAQSNGAFSDQAGVALDLKTPSASAASPNPGTGSMLRSPALTRKQSIKVLMLSAAKNAASLSSDDESKHADMDAVEGQAGRLDVAPASGATGDADIESATVRRGHAMSVAIVEEEEGEEAAEETAARARPSPGALSLSLPSPQPTMCGTRLRTTSAFARDGFSLDRLDRLAALFKEGLDDDTPNASTFVMVRRILEVEDAAANASSGWNMASRPRFRLTGGLEAAVELIENLGAGVLDLEGAETVLSKQKRASSRPSTANGRPLSPGDERGDAPGADGGPANGAPGTYKTNDAEWSLGCAVSVLEAPERWRRLPGPRKRTLANIPGGRTLRAPTITWDHYVYADGHIVQIATDLATEVQQASRCIKAHERELSFGTAAVSDVAPLTLPPSSPRRVPSSPSFSVMSSASPLSAGAPESGRASLIPDAAAASARQALRRYAALLSTHVPITLFVDWVVTHPVPRNMFRQLCYPLGKVASYDGLMAELPPADLRHKLHRTTEMTKSEQARLIARLVHHTGLEIPDLRELRTAFARVSQNGVSITYEQFRRLITEHLLHLAARRKEAAMMYNMKKAMREGRLETFSAHEDAPELIAPPPVPPFASMSESARKKLITRLFNCFDLNADGTVDLSEFAIGVSRVMSGSSHDKLSLIFDVYDVDGDGEVSLEELACIILGAFKLSDEGNNLTVDEMEKKQDDMEFARELADALDINGDGDISREEFFHVLRQEPLLFECFAASLNLRIGGLDAADTMDLATAAKSGPVFDFQMLRIIRDKYSIDALRNRGTSGATGKEDDNKASTGAGGGGGGGGGKGDDGSDDEFDADADHTTAPHHFVNDADDHDGDDLLAEEEEDDDADKATRADAVVKGRVRSSIMERAVDKHHFRKLLRDVWKCPDDALFLADRVFDFMDEDGSGSMDVRELYHGITSALRGTIEHRANFFFALFDTEGTGHLASEQILRMLLASSGGEDISEEDARRVLQKFDSDGSGTVEQDEFLEAVENDPAIVDSLSRVFGRTGAAATSLLAGADDADELESLHAHDAELDFETGSVDSDGSLSYHSSHVSGAGGALSKASSVSMLRVIQQVVPILAVPSVHRATQRRAIISQRASPPHGAAHTALPTIARLEQVHHESDANSCASDELGSDGLPSLADISVESMSTTVGEEGGEESAVAKESRATRPRRSQADAAVGLSFHSAGAVMRLQNEAKSFMSSPRAGTHSPPPGKRNSLAAADVMTGSVHGSKPDACDNSGATPSHQRNNRGRSPGAARHNLSNSDLAQEKIRSAKHLAHSVHAAGDKLKAAIGDESDNAIFAELQGGADKSKDGPLGSGMQGMKDILHAHKEMSRQKSRNGVRQASVDVRVMKMTSGGVNPADDGKPGEPSPEDARAKRASLAGPSADRKGALHQGATKGARERRRSSASPGRTHPTAASAGGMTTAVAATKKTGVHASPAAVAAGGADAASGGGEHTVRRPRKPTFVNPEASGPSRWYESTPEVSNLLDDANITLSKLTTVHEVLVRDKSSVLAMERRIVHSLRELSQVSHLRMEAEKRVAHARKVSEAHAKGEGADGASVVEIPPLPPTVIETLANGREGVLEASPRSVRLPPAPATIAQTAGAIAADAMCGHKESTRASGRGLPAALICDADTPLGIALLSPMTTLRPPRSPATKVSDWQERRSPGPASSTLLRSPNAVHNMDSMFRSSPSAVSAARSLFR